MTLTHTPYHKVFPLCFYLNNTVSPSNLSVSDTNNYSPMWYWQPPPFPCSWPICCRGWPWPRKRRTRPGRDTGGVAHSKGRPGEAYEIQRTTCGKVKGGQTPHLQKMQLRTLLIKHGISKLITFTPLPTIVWINTFLVHLLHKLHTWIPLYGWWWRPIVNSYHRSQCWEEDTCTGLSGSRCGPVQIVDWYRILLW